MDEVLQIEKNYITLHNGLKMIHLLRTVMFVVSEIAVFFRWKVGGGGGGGFGGGYFGNACGPWGI
jgi:uncharacterized membrane protein